MGRRFHEADHPRHPGFELRVPADELRPREAVFEVVHEGVRIVAEPDRAHPIRGRRDEDRAERAGTDREPDRLARASAPEHRRLHPEDLRGGRIEAAVRVEPGVVDRIGDRPAAPQRFAHPVRTVGGRVRPRRAAGGGLEYPVEMEWAHAGRRRERFEGGHLLGRLDEAAGGGHRLGVPLGDGRLVRAAPPAGPKARALRLLAGSVEADVLAPRPPGRAARAAVDAGRCDGIEEPALRARVAVHDRCPALVVASKTARHLGSGRHRLGHGISSPRVPWIVVDGPQGHVATGILPAAARSRTPVLAPEFVAGS